LFNLLYYPFFFLPLIGIIILVDDKKSHQSPTNAQIKNFEQNSLQEENKQLQEYINFIEEKKSKIENLRKNNILNQDIKEKKNKTKKTSLNDLKENNNTSLQQKQESQDPGNLSNVENKTSKVNGFAPIINIKTSSTSFAWYNDNENYFDSINIAKQNNLWNWPNTLKDIQKYKIFCDLWNKGYYITSGMKFGGDYLLYPGKFS
jgi:tRNA-splicing endonuclease subunit Sen34